MPPPAPSPSASPLESLAALRGHFRNTPARVLLQTTNAPYILHFLHLAFRKSGQISVPGATLRAMLQNYLEERRAEEPGYEWSAPETYLREWTNSHYLHSYYPDDGDDPHYQLTAETQRVLGWIDALRLPRHHRDRQQHTQAGSGVHAAAAGADPGRRLPRHRRARLRRQAKAGVFIMCEAAGVRRMRFK